MKRILVFLLLVWPTFTLAALDPATKNHLEEPPVDDWSAIALGRNGYLDITLDYVVEANDTATDLARKILAMTAQGVNPRDMNDTDFVNQLINKHVNGQFGNPNLINDDAWSIIALRNAGVTSNHPTISASITLLRSAQRSDGGWSFSVNGQSDTDDTAAVIMALREAGTSHDDPVIISARHYLDQARNSNGGYGFISGQSSNTASSAWVIWAKSYLGEADERARNFLSSMRRSDGAYRWRLEDTASSRLVTAYAAIALNTIPVTIATPTPLAPPVPPTPSPVITPAPITVIPTTTSTSTPTPVAITPIITSLSSPMPITVTPITPVTTVSTSYLTPVITPPLTTSYNLQTTSSLPLRLILDRGTVRVGEPITAWVEANRNGAWEAVNDARIHGGPVPLQHTRKSGTPIYFVRADTYQLRAEGPGYITSRPETVIALPLTEIKPYVETSSSTSRRLNSRRRVSLRRKSPPRASIQNQPNRLPTIGSRQR